MEEPTPRFGNVKISGDRRGNIHGPIRLAHADSLPHPCFSRGGPRHSRCDGDLVLDAVTDLVLTTSDGEELEAIHDKAPNTRGAIVVCHPHPLQGGTMNAPLIAAIARHAATDGLDVVRFNFRGVGASTGKHDKGVAELKDVTAAATYASLLEGGLVGIAGWSFGAAVALNWQANTQSSVPYVGVAPAVRSDLSPTLPDPEDLPTAQRAFVVGERDQIIDPEALAEYAKAISARIVTYRGSDHFFVLRHDKLATDVLRLLAS